MAIVLARWVLAAEIVSHHLHIKLFIYLLYRRPHPKTHTIGTSAALPIPKFLISSPGGTYAAHTAGKAALSFSSVRNG